MGVVAQPEGKVLLIRCVVSLGLRFLTSGAHPSSAG